MSSSSFSLSVIIICHCCSAMSSFLIIHCLWWVAFVACQWWRPFSIECVGEVIVCICRCLLSFVGGWDGRSLSLVGLPGLWAVVLRLFGGLPFIGSGGEWRLYVVSGGGYCQSSRVVGALLSAFADACPHLSSLHSPTYSYRTPTGLLDSYWILLGLQQISYWLITIQIWYPSPTGVLVNSYWNH